MNLDDPRLPDFLEAQIRDHGGKAEIDPGLWLLFALPAGDGPANSFARTLLGEAPFPHHASVSDDDLWMLYYVDDPNRPIALHWLADLQALLAGEVRPTAPAHRALIDDLASPTAPHRAAQRLVELHAGGELSAGAIREPATVRALLDRLHALDPLFFTAFERVLSHHLIDMIVLLRQMIPEDIRLKNDLVKAGLSRDPFLRRRQDAAVEIRHLLIRYHIINPLDQQKNTAVTNPYAAYLEIIRAGDAIAAPIDGTNVVVPRPAFLGAIQAVRRNLYRGGKFDSFDTQAPWMTEQIAYPFRFIKQQLAAHAELTTLDGLHMLERAADA